MPDHVAVLRGVGPVFMKLLEATLGQLQTTRTWDTVRRCGAAAPAA